MMYGFGSWGQGFGFGGSVFYFPLMLLMVWTLFWKGLALWHSARKKEPWWFVTLLVINTAGILEIVYLFGVAKIKFDDLFKK